MEIQISTDMASAFYEVADDKHGYASVCILKNIVIFHADVKEVAKMSLCPIESESEISFRAPIEILTNIIRVGKLEITVQKLNDISSNIEFKHYNELGALTVDIVIAYEACVAQSQILEINNAINSDKCTYIEDLSSFKKAIDMCRPNSKEIPISGAQIRDNKIRVIANGYYAEADDYTGLKIVIPASTLKYIVAFTRGVNRLRYCTLGGYNYIIANNSVLGWRRVRTEKLDFTIDYKRIFSFEVDYLKSIIGSIVSPVDYCVLSVNRNCLEITTAVAGIHIPLSIQNLEEDVADFKINTKLFFTLIKTFKGLVEVGFCNKSLVLVNDDVRYVIGRTV
jgi:hypothetical protein